MKISTNKENQMPTLIAYKGDPKLKKLMVDEVKHHQEADKIIQGTYGSNGKYCAVADKLIELLKEAA